MEEIIPTVSEEKDLWDFPFSDMPEEPTPGGYDGSGIAGGLGIDYDDTDFGDESEERSPDVTSEQEEASEAQSEAQSNFTDAEYQEVLDDLDHGNIEDVREFLEDLAHGGNHDTEEAPQYVPGDPEDGKLVDEGISIGDIVGGEEKNVEEGLEDANNTEEYTYDEDAYEDAEDALEDLQDALQDGDEEDLAEALEELQGYLGGFDKGEPKEDEENAPHNHGGSEEVANGVDKEAVEAPDASGAAVSGPALGGAAVGAGAVAGEAGGVDEDLVKEVQDFFGDMFGGGEAPAGAGAAAGAGAVGEAIDGATQQAGGAIDEASASRVPERS